PAGTAGSGGAAPGIGGDPGGEGGVIAGTGGTNRGTGGSTGAGGQSATGGAATGGGGSATSAGCGVATDLVSGRASLDVSGTTREYILKLPDGYDPNKPYRLIFGWHWSGGVANDVATGTIIRGPYYGLDKRAGGSAIFVAPD